MNSSNRHNNNANQAWERLHSRLDAEGLIPAKVVMANGSTQKKGSNYKSNHGKGRNIKESNGKGSNGKTKKPVLIYTMATAAVVMLMASVLYLLTNTNSFRNSTTIKLTNKEEQAISVTTLKDGSTIYMASQTSISFSKNFSKAKREISLQGNAYFEIENNQASPFIVETPSFIIKVLGTSFTVNYDTKGNPAVSVESGKVSIKLKNTGEEKTLTAGESTTIQKETFTNNTSQTPNSIFTKNNKLHFKDQILKDVVKVLNKKYPGSSITLSPKTEQRILTATFSGESPHTMAQMICKALGLKYIDQEGAISIYE